MTTETERPPTYVLNVDSQMVISRKPIALRIGSWDQTETPTEWPNHAHPEREPQRGIHWRVRMTCFAVRGTKDHPVLTYGTVGTSGVQADWRHEHPPGSPTEFMAQWDNRYGVDAEATWDGDTMWAKDMRWSNLLEMHDLLAPVFDALPEVPHLHTGWWLQPRRTKESAK